MRGGRRGLAPPLRWCGSLFKCLRIAWVCWSLQITSCGLYEPLSISCCSCYESLRILADRTGSFSFCFTSLCGFMLIFTDHLAEVRRLESPLFPSLSDVPNLVVSMGGQVSIFHCSGSVWQCQLAAAYRGGSRSWGCHGYLPAFCPEVCRPPANT